ncbi:MAG: isochorismatase family protein [Paludibacteraceae bacterium]|nr:isochorismatase family protein [Paludibacteraceae bacterium]
MITAIDKNTALVLIDLQKGVVKKDTYQSATEILKKSVILIDAFREKGLPIVVVNVNPIGASWLNARKDQKSMLANKGTQTIAKVGISIGGFLDILDEIKTEPTDIFITKKTWNAFYNTPLHEELQKRNITGIVLAGVATSIGVEGTARAAAELGYNISFAIDAMTDQNPEAHQNSIRNIFPRLGESGTTSDIIGKL